MDDKFDQYGSDLTRIRCAADLKQAVVARKAGIDASRLSRIESGEIQASEQEIVQITQAIGTPLAGEYLEFRQHVWNCLARPSFWNPDRKSLVLADRRLAQLDGPGASMPEASTAAQIELYRTVLKESAQFLSRVDHAVGFMGKIGVGKSAGICGLTGLMLNADGGHPNALSKRTVLEVGSGRMTLCEVAVRTGPDGYYGLRVVPCSQEEVFRAASDYCASAIDIEVEGTSALQPSQTRGVPEEVAKALRNMAGFARLLPQEHEASVSPQTSLSGLAASLGGSLQEVTAEFIRRMRLEQRTTTEFALQDTDPDRGLRWVRGLFSKINKGQHAEVSLPKRIELTVPLPLLDASPLEIRLIDTKGIEDTALRPDLRQHLDDPRAVTVLCSRFNSAPDECVGEVLENLAETGGQRTISERIAILVLARSSEVLDTQDDEGNLAETNAQGYRLKEDQVRAALRKIGGSERVPLHFYDVLSDGPAAVRHALVEQVRSVRSRYARQIADVCQAAEAFLASRQKKEVQRAHAEVRRRLRTYLDQHRQLPGHAQPLGNLFLSTLSTKHPRTVWATTRRNGTWGGLDAYHLMGQGAASDAQRRCQPAYNAFTMLIAELLGDHSIRTAHDYVAELQRAAIAWREKFVSAASGNGREISRVALFDEDSTWNECEAKWTLGRGFRSAVYERLTNWFEVHPTLFHTIDKRILEAWDESFVAPLAELAGTSDDTSEATRA